MEQKNKVLVWKWNHKPVELTKLDDKQLFSIKKSINTSNNKVWFGIDSKVWLSSINNIINERYMLINIIKKRRYNRALAQANLITNKILIDFKSN